MKINLLWAFIENIRIPLLAIGIIGLVIGFISCCFKQDTGGHNDDEKKETSKWWKNYFKIIPFFLFLCLLSGLPSVEDLWKVRIGLIKLELASPENLSKSSEVIERIGKKLECKYLGCEEEKKK